MSALTMTRDSAFTRKRVVRIGAGVASAGVLAGFSLIGATPAMAVSDADCAALPTVDAGAADPTGDIQTLLDNPVIGTICLSGNIVLDNTLFYNRDVTLHGLPGATLDGTDTYTILEETGDTFPPITLTIESLHLTNGTGDDGGAIDAYGFVDVYDSVFDLNDADFSGGAISAYGVYAHNTVFDQNTASVGGAVLGGAFVDVTQSTFTLNEGFFDGGAIASYGFVGSYSSTFFDNFTGGDGGAIYSENDDNNDALYVENSTFVDNYADSDAGAIATTGGTILQSTFLNNTAPTDNAESVQLFHDFESDATTLLLRANLFSGADTTLPQLWVDDDGTEFVDGGGNLFSTSAVTEAESFTAADASTRFDIAPAALYETGALGDNGGPTQTVALSDTSPAIDAVPVGEPSVLVDQRGVARTALSDSGAYEHEPVLAATGVVPAGWMGGAAALLLAAGAAAFGFTRRRSIR